MRSRELLVNYVVDVAAMPVLYSMPRGSFPFRFAQVVMTNAIIRPVSAADSDAIARIYNYYIEHTVVTFEEQSVSAADMAARIAEAQGLSLPWLVAEVEGEVAGYAYARRWRPRSAYRYSAEITIYLERGHEGRRIGTTLYSALLPLLRERGIHVAIGGVALPNDASVALHEKLGFERVATFRQVGFKHDQWVDVAYWQLVLSDPHASTPIRKP